MWISQRSVAKQKIPRYVCPKRPGHPGCGGVAIVADPLDELITDAVLYRLGTKQMTKVLHGKPRRAGIDVDLTKLERDLEDLASDFGEGRITRREWLAARKPLEERIAKARRLLDADSGTTALAPFRGTDVRVVWDKLDVDRRRAVLGALIDRIIVQPAARPGRGFDAGRVEVVWKV